MAGRKRVYEPAEDNVIIALCAEPVERRIRPERRSLPARLLPPRFCKGLVLTLVI